MAQDFICPYCKGKLNVKGFIVFSVKTKEDKRGLIFVSPELGNYQTFTHPSFRISKGEQHEFLCPICHSNLAAIEVNENLVKVLMTGENGKVYEILFSGIAGEKCTYKLKDGQLEVYGEDSERYRNFFGEGVRE
jgi:uncharacterized protein YbaR (Trm112 family)